MLFLCQLPGFRQKVEGAVNDRQHPVALGFDVVTKISGKCHDIGPKILLNKILHFFQGFQLREGVELLLQGAQEPWLNRLVSQTYQGAFEDVDVDLRQGAFDDGTNFLPDQGSVISLRLWTGQDYLTELLKVDLFLSCNALVTSLRYIQAVFLECKKHRVEVLFS